ncbi:MAG: hypothetical protein MZV70_45580 [Desulfobacterales bacterium]|nr:hypothetical protein [Desulfobacterales bacterium]
MASLAPLTACHLPRDWRSERAIALPYVAANDSSANAAMAAGEMTELVAKLAGVVGARAAEC